LPAADHAAIESLAGTNASAYTVAKRHGISATRVKRIWAETDHESGPIVPYTTEQDDGNERRSGPFAVTTGRTKHAKMASSSSSSYSVSDGVDPDVAAALEQLDVSLAAIDAQGGPNRADETMVAETRELNDALAHAQVITRAMHTRNAKQLRTKSSKHGHRQLQESAPPPRQLPIGRQHAAPQGQHSQRGQFPARLREGGDDCRSGGRCDSPRGGQPGPWAVLLRVRRAGLQLVRSGARRRRVSPARSGARVSGPAVRWRTRWRSRRVCPRA
jgi:hypothetical protein